MSCNVSVLNFLFEIRPFNPPAVSICPNFNVGRITPYSEQNRDHRRQIAEKTHQKTRAALKTPAMVPKSCHLVLLATALQAAAISSRGRPVTATNFYPARVSRSELYQTTSNRAVVRDVDQALKEDGLIAVEVPGFDALNHAVLRAAHECIDSTKTPQATLADGTVRRSLATSRSNNEAGPLDVPETCAPLAAAEVEFRAAVWSVAEAVAAARKIEKRGMPMKGEVPRSRRSPPANTSHPRADAQQFPTRYRPWGQRAGVAPQKPAQGTDRQRHADDTPDTARRTRGDAWGWRADADASAMVVVVSRPL